MPNPSSNSPSPTRVGAATRDRILDAAEKVFGSKGFRRTTLDDVAGAAGVSRPLIYRYYRNKDTLYRTTVKRILRAWNDALATEAARTTPGTAHKLRLVLTSCLAFAREREVLQGLLVRDAGLVTEKHGRLFETGNDLLRELVGRILEEGQLRGDVRTDLELGDMAHVVSELFISYTFRALTGEVDEIGERRLHTILETLLHGVVALPPSGRGRSNEA